MDRIPILTPWRLIRHEYVKKQLLDSCRKCYHRTFCAKIAEILLKAHANPNFLTNRGNSVLDALFRKRHFIPPSWDGLETLKLLIQHGLGFSSDKFIKNDVISHAYFLKSFSIKNLSKRLNRSLLSKAKTTIENAFYLSSSQKQAFLGTKL